MRKASDHTTVESMKVASEAYPKPRLAYEGMRKMLVLLDDLAKPPTKEEEQSLLREVRRDFGRVNVQKDSFNSYIDGAICLFDLIGGNGYYEGV